MPAGTDVEFRVDVGSNLYQAAAVDQEVGPSMQTDACDSGDGFIVPETVPEEWEQAQGMDEGRSPPCTGHTVEERGPHGFRRGTSTSSKRHPLSPSQALNRPPLALAPALDAGPPRCPDQLRTPAKPTRLENRTPGSGGKKGANQTPRRGGPSPRLSRMALEDGRVAPGPWVGQVPPPSAERCGSAEQDRAVPRSRVERPAEPRPHAPMGVQGIEEPRPQLRLELADTQDIPWSPVFGARGYPDGKQERRETAVGALVDVQDHEIAGLPKGQIHREAETRCKQGAARGDGAGKKGQVREKAGRPAVGPLNLKASERHLKPVVAGPRSTVRSVPLDTLTRCIACFYLALAGHCVEA